MSDALRCALLVPGGVDPFKRVLRQWRIAAIEDTSLVSTMSVAEGGGMAKRLRTLLKTFSERC
jgi:hypothetical protein